MQQADNLKLYFKVIFLAQQADVFENPDIGTIELIGRAHVLLWLNYGTGIPTEDYVLCFKRISFCNVLERNSACYCEAYGYSFQFKEKTSSR